MTDTLCAALPGAQWADPADGKLPSWKVGGKMFASFGHRDPGVSVKTPSVDDATMLIVMGRASRAPYFHRSWIRVDWDAVPEDELRDRIETSYRLIVAGLPKKLRP